jgi:plastocyanin
VRPVLRVLRAVAALGGAAALVVPALGGHATAADQTVQVGADGANKFTPASVTIRVGDTVTWQYAGGTGHTVTSTSSNWKKDTPVGPPAILTLSTTYTFDAAGTYRYVCSTHDSVGMKGTVTVLGKTKPKPTPTKTTSPRPSASRTSSPPPSASASSSGSPTPSSGSATPAIPSASLGTPGATTAPPLPSVAPTPGVPQGSTFLGTGGLTAQPATGRTKGLPVLLALLLIGGVGSAELRALLANAPE